MDGAATLIRTGFPEKRNVAALSPEASLVRAVVGLAVFIATCGSAAAVDVAELGKVVLATWGLWLPLTDVPLTNNRVPPVSVLAAASSELFPTDNVMICELPVLPLGLELDPTSGVPLITSSDPPVSP
jgi:hypothetical protein